MSIPTRYRQLLTEALAIKSVSTDPAFESEMKKMADWLNRLFKSYDFEVQTITGYGQPIVVARYEADPQLETLLIYGHYDVQPARSDEGWHADPFSLYEDKERLYGRGVVDNKGQFLIHLATILELIENNTLGYNIIFLIEGDEETGSPELERFLADHTALLSADGALISDGEIAGENQTVELGFRGTFNATIRLRTAPSDLHSGLFGSSVPSAAHQAANLVSALHNSTGRVTIPEFYNGVEDIKPIDRDELKESNWLKLTGVKRRLGESGLDPETQTGRRPALEVTGLTSGHTTAGYRNSIPATAEIKLNIRLVFGQDSEAIAQNLKQFVQDLTGELCDIEIETKPPVPAVLLETDNRLIQRIGEIIKAETGAPPKFQYCGGTLPIAHYFRSTLNLPQAFVPLANQDSAMHGVNENLSKKQLEQALRFSHKFLRS